jgi:hypothetical protein
MQNTLLNVFIYGPYGLNDYNLILNTSKKLLKNLGKVNVILFTSSIAIIDDCIVKLSQELNYDILRVNGVYDAVPITDLFILFRSTHCPECKEILELMKSIPNRIIDLDYEI